MDGDRFDSLARSLSAAGSRRRAFAIAFSGGQALLGLARPDDAVEAKSGKCKPKCGACETCQKGNCKRKNGKKQCKKGKCKPRKGVVDCPAGQLRNPVTCGCCQVAGQTCPVSGANSCCSGLCPGGTCESRVSGAPCAFGAECGTGVCRNGVCACSELRERCFQNGDCCGATTGLAGSVVCSTHNDVSGIVCCVSGTGLCATSADCCSDLRCNGGTCS
jgi:hypothetical protein